MTSLFHMFPSSDELYHYGVKGMRRGVRRKGQPTTYGYASPLDAPTSRDYSRKTTRSHNGSYANGRIALTKRQTTTNPTSLSRREYNRSHNEFMDGRRSSVISRKDLKSLMTGRLDRRRGTQDAYSKNSAGTDKASTNRNANKRARNVSRRRFADMVNSHYDRGMYRINARSSSTYYPRQMKSR